MGKEANNEDNDKEDYICPQHLKRHGYESCCECTGDRECDEAIRRRANR